MRSWLRQTVPSSAVRSVRLWAGRPLGVRARPALVFAAGERLADGIGRGDRGVVGEQHRREPGLQFEQEVVGE
jgi:hypothetical protein